MSNRSYIGFIFSVIGVVGSITSAIALGFYVRDEFFRPPLTEQEFERRYSQNVEGLRTLAEKADPRAQLLLGEILASQSDTAVEARIWFFRAAALGNPKAQHKIASMIERGIGGEQNTTKALQWYLKAAAQSYGPAAYQAALIYLFGSYEVPRDYNKALPLFKQANEQGIIESYAHIGLMYLRGEGVTKDPGRALDYLRTGASLGDGMSAEYLGWRYYRGEGVVQDFVVAFRWFETAARLGRVNGQVQAGFMLHTGQGVQKNEKEACDWFEKAADRGHIDGSKNLGACYFKGSGREFSVDKARRWLKIAADAGNIEAVVNLDKLEIYLKKKKVAH